MLLIFNFTLLTFTCFFGGHSEEVPPVPIPNTAVKLFCADGTAWETVWESRSPPFFIEKPLWAYAQRGFCFQAASFMNCSNCSTVGLSPGPLLM